MHTVSIEAFNRKIEKHRSELQSTRSGFLPLYDWQQEGFKYRYYQTVLYNTPTASGKSVLMRVIAADEHVNHGRRVVIVVPTQDIAKEFEDVETNRLRWQAGKTQIPEFIVTHPLYTEPIQGRIKTLKEFLKSANSGIIVVCNQTMIGALRNLDTKYLDNLCVLVDEAHHSSSVSYDDDESVVLSDEMNEMGRVIRKCYNAEVVLRFFTATFFRDDRRQVVPDDIMETAKVYDMKLHDFLQDSQLTEVENIFSDIRFAKGDNTNEKGGHHFALKSIWDANPNMKTAIWLSNPNKFDKVYQTERAIETLGKPIVSKAKLKRMGVTDEELESSRGTVIYLDYKGELKRVVELSLQSVDECSHKLRKWYRGSVGERNDRENYFNKVKNDHIDACIYLNKGQEGTNWRALERVVIYEQRKLGRATQMIGRALRKWSGKKDVCVHFVLPQILCTTLNEDARDKINEYVNALWASMIIDNIIEPLFLRAKRERGKGNGVARDQSEFDSVFALRSDEGTYLRNCAELIDQWYEDFDNEPSGHEIKKKFREIVEGQLEYLKIEPNNIQKFVRATWQRLVVKKQEIQGKNIVIDYNMIMNEDNPIGCAKAFYGITMTKEFALEFKELLDCIRGIEYKSEEEHIIRAVELGTTSRAGNWKNRGDGYYAFPEHHFDNFWSKVRNRLGVTGQYDERPSEEEHIIRAVELGATSARHNGNWKNRGDGYYWNPEIYFTNFWSKVRNRLGVTGKFDEKYSEEEHINRAVELGATSSNGNWKNRGDGYYALPAKYFTNFWSKVRTILKNKDSK